MGLVGRVGRKRFRARLAIFFVYLALCLGAVTTLYPFLLMFSTGMKGASDQNTSNLVPRFLEEDFATDFLGRPAKESLYGKYLNDKYAGDDSLITSTRIG